MSGDFTFYPKESLHGLEKSLEGAPLKKNQITHRVKTYLEEEQIELPRVEAKDIALTILDPTQGSKGK